MYGEKKSATISPTQNVSLNVKLVNSYEEMVAAFEYGAPIVTRIKLPKELSG
jgi:hypothetical protein